MTPTATALPPTIQQKLRSLRARLRRLTLLEGATRVTLGVLGFILGTFLLDRSLDLPAMFRLVLLVGGVAGVGFLAWRFLARPLARVADDDQVALAVEREHPELRDELISAVQLSRLPPERQAFHSQALVRRVLEEAEEGARRIDFSKVASGRDLARIGLATALLLFVVAAIAATRPRDARIWAERMLLLGDTPWPRSVELIVEVSDDVVARGEDVVVTARVERGNPSRVVVLPEFASTSRRDEIPMVQAQAGFRAVFENVDEPFTFVVEGGDFRSRRFSVDVRERPKIAEVKVALDYPPYTGLEDPPEPLSDGNLKVPSGTLVRFEALATAPLREAEVVFATPAAVEVRKAAAVEGGRTVAGEFLVKDSTAWSFRLVSEEGFESAVAAQYSIRAVLDRLPKVRITKPGRNKDVTPQGTVALAVEVEDDYRPLAAALVLAVAAAPEEGGAAPAGAPAPKEERVALAGLPLADAAARKAELAHELGLADFGLKPGDRVTYWVEAVDNRAPSPDTTSVARESRGASEKLQLRVVTAEDFARAQQARLKRVRDDLAQTGKAQKAVRDDLEALFAEVAGRPADERDRRRLSYAEFDQRKVGQRLERARDEIADVRDELAANEAATEDDLAWHGELAALAEQLVAGKAQPALAALGALRQAERPDPAKIQEAARLGTEVMSAIDEIVRRLDKWDEYNEIVRDLRDLSEAQERIREAARARVRQDHGEGAAPDDAGGEPR